MLPALLAAAAGGAAAPAEEATDVLTLLEPSLAASLSSARLGLAGRLLGRLG